MTESGTYERARASVERAQRVLHNMQNTLTTALKSLDESKDHIATIESRSGIIKNAVDNDTLPKEATEILETKIKVFNERLTATLSKTTTTHHRSKQRQGFVPV